MSRSMKLGIRAAALALALATSVAAGAERPAPFVPPHWPANNAPVDWPGNPGTRYEMPDFAAKCPPAQRVWKIKVAGWTKENWEKDLMGRCGVGDTVAFEAMVGQKDSEFFGSVKDRRDGGTFRATIFWMDEGGKKVLKEDATSVRLACATCAGYWGLYFNIPSTARTGRHRLHMSYVHEKLGMSVTKDLYFDVVNDGSWEKDAVLEAVRAKRPAVAVLQSGQACPRLGPGEYRGTRDTYFMSPNPVPDRREDHCNFGQLEYLRVGLYGPEKRALVGFDLSGLSRECEVAEAWVQLYLWSFDGRPGHSLTVQAFEVLKPWQQGRGSGNPYEKSPILPGEASWQCSAFPAKWEAWGCDAAGSDRAAQPAGQAEKVTQPKRWVSIKLDSRLVAKWIKDPQSNHGIVLMDPKGSCGVFHSSEYEDPALRPTLILAFPAGRSPTTQPAAAPAYQIGAVGP